MSSSDTIIAQATPQGIGGVAIVRISGPNVQQIASQILGQLPQPRQAHYSQFSDHENHVLDLGIALFFPSPNSFTGEDVLELHGHGGPVVVDLLLQHLLTLGTRMANPGEFSLRAFLNNKMDLTQAEAISDLIESTSADAARASMRSLQGVFSKKVSHIADKLLNARLYMEASLDFSDEDIDLLEDGILLKQVDNIQQDLSLLLDESRRGCLLREGLQVVISGEPNVGKSSLLNKLSGEDTAIVTNIPGTTRDLIREKVNIGGLSIQLTDTAGLRHSENMVEQEGIKRALDEVKKADRVLLVMDDQLYSSEEQMKQYDKLKALNNRIVRIYNKIDLSLNKVGIYEDSLGSFIRCSIKKNLGIEHIYQSFNDHKHTFSSEGVFTARRRHITALESTQTELTAGLKQFKLSQNSELLAEDLRQAHRYLGEITGQISSDDLLGHIFSSFCIGK
jgi:tRNA modification GTPase